MPRPGGAGPGAGGLDDDARRGGRPGGTTRSPGAPLPPASGSSVSAASSSSTSTLLPALFFSVEGGVVEFSGCYKNERYLTTLFNIFFVDNVLPTKHLKLISFY